MSPILVERAGAIAIITLNRPEARNALRIADLEAFSAGLRDLAEDAALRVLILTGAGDKVFSAGMAFEDVIAGDWVESPLTACCDLLEAFPRPVIAALNGTVHGGAAEIAAACDFRIGVEGCAVVVPPAKLGIHYDAPGMARLVRLMGLQPARRLLLAGETLGTAELLALGFLDAAVAPGNVLTAAHGKAQEIAALAPMAVAGMKRTLNEIAAGRLDVEAAKARAAACRASADFREGLAAAQARRPPVFSGE